MTIVWGNRITIILLYFFFIEFTSQILFSQASTMWNISNRMNLWTTNDKLAKKCSFLSPSYTNWWYFGERKQNRENFSYFFSFFKDRFHHTWQAIKLYVRTDRELFQIWFYSSRAVICLHMWIPIQTILLLWRNEFDEDVWLCIA